MSIHYPRAYGNSSIPGPELDLEVPPEISGRQEESRVIDRMFDATAKSDRAEFNRHFREFTALKRRQASSTPAPNGSSR